MAEQLERLRATIRELEDELGELTTIDAQTRGLLEEILAEVQAVMERLADPAVGKPPLSGQLSRLAARFETSHPTLFGVVTRLSDALAQIGI